MRRFIACALVSLAGCREPELMGAVASLHFSVDSVNLGAVYAAHESKTATVQLRNDGKAPAKLTWKVPAAPFEVAPLPETLESGAVELTIRFNPQEVGKFTDALRVESEGLMPQTVVLVAEARAVPQCPPAKPCLASYFDFAKKKCVEEPLANGTTCDPKTACLTGPTCQAGRCVGQARNCDDANLCTVDTCNDVVGCEHLPAPPCPGDGECQVGVCRPESGCGLTDADDGVACGPMQSCDAAQVCIAGSCVVRDPPDGYVCAEASPCQDEGICAGSVCVRPAATALVPSWNYDSKFADAGAGLGPAQFHDLVLEPSGAASLSSFFHNAPQLRANTPASKPAKDGTSRRCMLWNGRLICADYPSSSPQGKVSAIDLATGELVWTFDLATARPGFLAMTNALFMARMAVQGTDRLAALFEAYPKSATTTGATNCRLYFLAVLDGAGKLVSAQQVTDPLLTVCDHPHPYGFGTDSFGDLFISFSPTTSSVAPLVPGSPTMLMSYTRDGVFRWKFTDLDLVGGELAVARGLIYPENGKTAVLTATGEAGFSLAEPFGRAVVTRQRTITAPTVGAKSLNAYEAGTATARWSHALGAGQTFGSDQLRLASWSTRRGPQTVALTFTTLFGRTQLHAIVARDGSPAFTCDLTMNSRTEPQLFEVADGSLTLMEGSDSCGKCDPPYAESSAAFHTLPLPHISPANLEPWVGTFGGAGHDHHEEPPVPLGPPQ